MPPHSGNLIAHDASGFQCGYTATATPPPPPFSPPPLPLLLSHSYSPLSLLLLALPFPMYGPKAWRVCSQLLLLSMFIHSIQMIWPLSST